MIDPSQDARSVEQLLLAARDTTCPPDSEEYWAATWALQFRLDPGLLSQLRDLARSHDPSERRFVADVLAQGYVGDKRLRDECTGTLLEMLRGEEALSVIIAIGNAFGHLQAA